jgi:hypothetical protein
MGFKCVESSARNYDFRVLRHDWDRQRSSERFHKHCNSDCSLVQRLHNKFQSFNSVQNIRHDINDDNNKRN